MPFRWILLVLLFVAVAVIAVVMRTRIMGAGRGVRGFFEEVLVEMKKVAWPTKDHVIGSTILVGITSIGLMIFIGISDRIFGWLVGLIFLRG